MPNNYIPEERALVILRSLGYVDRIITLLLIETGFRLDDVMHLRLWQLTADTLSVRERKTGHVRSVVVPSVLADKLRVYAAGRHRLAYAFPCLRRAGKNKMHRTTYWRHFVAACERHGWGDCGYTPHSLRKLYAVRKLAETRSLKAVQDDLGHTSPAVTALYALSDRL